MLNLLRRPKSHGDYKWKTVVKLVRFISILINWYQLFAANFNNFLTAIYFTSRSVDILTTAMFRAFNLLEFLNFFGRCSNILDQGTCQHCSERMKKTRQNKTKLTIGISVLCHVSMNPCMDAEVKTTAFCVFQKEWRYLLHASSRIYPVNIRLTFWRLNVF
jgi:hypothetical protein